jgi:hypothetical protein
MNIVHHPIAQSKTLRIADHQLSDLPSECLVRVSESMFLVVSLMTCSVFRDRDRQVLPEQGMGLGVDLARDETQGLAADGAAGGEE